MPHDVLTTLIHTKYQYCVESLSSIRSTVIFRKPQFYKIGLCIGNHRRMQHLNCNSSLYIMKADLMWHIPMYGRLENNFLLYNFNRLHLHYSIAKWSHILNLWFFWLINIVQHKYYPLHWWNIDRLQHVLFLHLHSYMVTKTAEHLKL